MTYPNTTPTYRATSSKVQSQGEFSFEISYWAPDKKEVALASAKATKEVYELLKEKVMAEIPTLLTYANFLGEAESYMVAHGIPFNKQIRQQYAIAIRAEFLATLDSAISFNDIDNTIELSPYIFSLEAGDFYRPSVQFISKTILKWLEDLQEK